MAKLQKSGYGKIWPMQQNMGRDKHGRQLYREVFLDVSSGAIHFEFNKNGEYAGWNGNPPNGLSEQPILSSNEAFRRGFDQIRWDSPKKE